MAFDSLKVAIVGAGPAGMSAAVEAHRRGARVTLIDEAAKPGGQIFRQSAAGSELRIGLATELARKEALLSKFNGIVDNIDYRPGHTAYAMFDGPELHVSRERSSQVLRPDVVVIATGVCERAVPFPGWTTPGVVYAGGAQALLKSQGVTVGERVVIAGTGPLPVAVAAQLAEAGVDVVAVALLNSLRSMMLHPYALWKGRQVVREGWKYFKILRRHGVEVLPTTMPLRVDGGQHIKSIQFARHDGTGRPLLGTERRIECDALAVNYGFTANSELVTMAGGHFEYLPARGGWVPVTDKFCRSSIPCVLVAGDAARLRGAWVAQAEGRIAGAVAADYYDERAIDHLRQELPDCFVERGRHEAFQQAIQQSLQLPAGVWGWADDDTIVCRCECVTHGHIQRALDDGHTTLNGIKKNTRAGMGWCGGRMCMQNVAACMKSGRTPADLQPMTPRPLARPITLRALRDQQAP